LVRPLNVLMVEDNLADALLVQEAIQMEGLDLNIQPALDGEMAIAAIERAEKDPAAAPLDAVLLDLNLPRVDGFEVLRRIRSSERLRRLPVIVITSSDSPADRREGANLGAAYFRKRPDYDEFLKVGGVIRRFLEEHGLLRNA
jgi:two-component system, chemotaxis family, response regulator Rcp1